MFFYLFIFLMYAGSIERDPTLGQSGGNVDAFYSNHHHRYMFIGTLGIAFD